MRDQSQMYERGSAVMLGFVLGALMGAGAALLLAPASGEETRRRIGDSARRLREDTQEKVDRARGVLSELKEDAKSAVDAGREAYVRGRQSHETRSSRRGAQGYEESSTPLA